MTKTAVKERPILYSDPMVDAIRDGRKTQTRRIVKNADWLACLSGDCPHDLQSECDESLRLECPYGQPGDRLWVRESFLPCSGTGSRHPVAIDDATYVCFRDGSQKFRESGDYFQSGVKPAADVWPSGASWRPSIHLPRWASRFDLEITGVRIQRLQEISEEDARAEGVDWASPEPWGERWKDEDREDPRQVGYDRPGSSFARDNFRRLWHTIHAATGSHGWDANPHVWAITFRRISG